MKKIPKKKIILLVGVIFLLLFLTGCQRNADDTGMILAERIIYLDTPWMSDAIKSDLFTFLIVYPLAQCINFLDQYVGVVGAIALTTTLFNIAMLGFSIKSTVSSQKMQLIQPDVRKIQDKYKDRKDQNSQVQMGAEMQALYKKHDISMGGALLVPFLQLPIMMAMYYAVQRAYAVVNGSFLGAELSMSPRMGIETRNVVIIAIFIVMLIAQYGSMKITAYLSKRSKAKSGVKVKEYANDGKEAPVGMGNGMQLGMIVMIGVLAFGWPTAMSLYWVVSSTITIIKTWFIQWRFIDNAKA